MAEVPDGSILDTTKKVLGFEADYKAFDPDIVMHINSVFFTLQQLGVGPTTGFSITDSSSKWSEFTGVGSNLEAVKTYMALRVRLLFDPPGTSFVLESMRKQAEEFEWRLNITSENAAYEAAKTQFTPTTP